MKKLLFLIYLLPLLSFSQDSISKKERRFSIGLIFSPCYTYRKLVAFDSTYLPNVQAVDSLNSIESGKISVTPGISLAYRFTKHLRITVGLNISDKGYRSKGFGWNNSYWEGYAIFKQNFERKSRIYFYEVPVSLSYSTYLDHENRYSLNVFGGIAVCQNMHKFQYVSRRFWNGMNNFNLNQEGDFINLYADAHSVSYLGYIAGLGFNIHASKKIYITAEPVFKYYFWHRYVLGPDLNKIYITWTGVIDKPYSIGCNLGLRYSF